MSLKWTNSNSESGILRKSEFKEKKEELFVFGYSCKLFRDDEKALQIDQGKHLIPWMGDETLKIDRGCFEALHGEDSAAHPGPTASQYNGDTPRWYDARGALHDLTSHEAPPGGFDWRVELTKTELDVEQLCDEERYRALYTDEDEEEMYREEELKRLHAAGYGQVGFNYDAPAQPEQQQPPAEADEPFDPTPNYKALFTANIVFPETDKHNVIIEKTAKFIASQGAQMEILIKAKQGDNPQFKFLNREDILHPYYTALIALIKAGKWPEKKPEIVEDKPHENEDYLHPSLAATMIEAAPSIPSIHYKPSADCDYTMLISAWRGSAPPTQPYTSELAPGEEPPPGTEPLPPRDKAQIARAPVMYTRREDTAVHEDQKQAEPQQAQPQQAQYTQAEYQQYLAYYQQYQQKTALQNQAQSVPETTPVATPAQQPQNTETKKPVSLKSTGLSLMKNYNTDSDSDVSDCDDTSSTDSKEKIIIVTPPEEVQAVIEKMADYVSRNGAEFADIVRAKGDPRFAFLEPSDIHHTYYCSRLDQIQKGETNPPVKRKAPVSFSIKKIKEPDPILPKPALPYESSSEEETEKDKQSKQEESKNNLPAINQNNLPVVNNIPTVVYKMESTQVKDLPLYQSIETIKPIIPQTLIPHVIAFPKIYKEEKNQKPETPKPIPKIEVPKIEESKLSETPEVKISDQRNDSPRIDRSEKKEYLESKEIRRSPDVKRRSPDVKRRSPDVKRRSPEVKRRSPDVKIRSPDVKRRSPDVKRRSPDVKRRSPDIKKRSPDVKRRSPDVKRSPEKDKKSNDDDKSKKSKKDDFEGEIISLEDNSDEEMIDLTQDLSDSKVSAPDVKSDRARSKQLARKRRAAEFLRRVGVDPVAASALPASSLASAMVDTLESLRKKKAEAEAKKRKLEKRRHREKYELSFSEPPKSLNQAPPGGQMWGRGGRSEEADKSHRKSKRRKNKSSDDHDSDNEGYKKKKRKKEKKSSKSKKKKRYSSPEVVEVREKVDHPLPPEIDLTSTLKELRTASPTKDLVLQVDEPQPNAIESSSEEEKEIRRRRKRKRKKQKQEEKEHSEGEWSSDSEEDSEDSKSED